MPTDTTAQPIPESTPGMDEKHPSSLRMKMLFSFSRCERGRNNRLVRQKNRQEILQPNSPRVLDVTALVDVLHETIKTVNEQNARIRMLGSGRWKTASDIRGGDHRSRGDKSPPLDETPTHSPGWSDDEVYRGPLSKQIMDLELPHGLQKPPQLEKYNGLTDPDIRIQNIEVILNYPGVRGGIKCIIFPTSLVKCPMAWYRSLPQGSITSWKDLCKQFTSHFTASRKHPKMEANLEVVVQGKNESLRNYIERFNKEVVHVDTNDDMKRYLLRKNLCDGIDFKRAVWIENKNYD
ncbi:hypothetical protein TSUD_04640 [Trifolium subterraneum]|nr:hypothetical protein TSUD_04640 [Trifolium subterraneum]